MDLSTCAGFKTLCRAGRRRAPLNPKEEAEHPEGVLSVLMLARTLSTSFQPNLAFEKDVFLANTDTASHRGPYNWKADLTSNPLMPQFNLHFLQLIFCMFSQTVPLQPSKRQPHAVNYSLSWHIAPPIAVLVNFTA
jgi:hypothetical protein